MTGWFGRRMSLVELIAMSSAASESESAMSENERSQLKALMAEWRRMFDAAKTPTPPEAVMAGFAAEDLPGLIQAATVPRPGTKTTSPRAAQELCYAARYCLEHGIQMPAVLQDYIISGLTAGVEGRSVDAAFRLKRGAGQSEDPAYVQAKELRIASRMYGLLHCEGRSEADAKERASEEFGLDTRRIEQIWQKFRPAPELLEARKARDQAWLERFWALYAQMPQPCSGDAYEDWLRAIQAHIARME